uniref:Putative LOV domain-containing protein n=1 Tax=Scapania nemorea TaxID=41848 RepID=A0A126WXY6_SCANE|nr:putative LOV domain-containing protein [Scapania nemorea]
MGKPFMSSQLELARNRQRDSLDIFGQTSLLQQQHRAPGSQTNVPLFSRLPGSAWDDALKEAERLLEGSNIPSGRPSNAKRSEQRSDKGPAAAVENPKNNKSTDNDAGVIAGLQQQQGSFLNDIVGHLEAAEKNPKIAAKQWASVSEESFRMEDHVDQQEQHQQAQRQQLTHYQRQRHESSDGYDSRRSRKSDDSVATTRSEVSEDYMQERASQWGYGVVLKSSSKESTPRTSGASSTGRSRAGSSSSQALPVVSRDVKDALSSFMLAFLVCDYADPEMPILYCSSGFTTMTGYSTDDIVGKNCRFLQGPDTDRTEIAKLKEALKKGSIYTGTLLNYKKDGTPFWNLLTLSPIKDDDGKVIKYIGMQAEQHSKEAQPRNSKGQKSPAVRAVPGPSKLSTSSQDGYEKQKRMSEEAGPSQRRNSAGSASTPRPPLVPQKASPAATAAATLPSSADRRNSGPELRYGEDLTRRMSQRYSLTSNPTRSTRNSTVDEFRQAHRSRSSLLTNSSVTSSVEELPQPQHRKEASAAAFQLREMVLNRGNSSSSFEGPGTSSKRDSQSSAQSSASSEASKYSSKKEKSTNRLTARILRLFRKDSKVSSRRLEDVARGKEIVDLSASDDERDDFNDISARSSEGRHHSSVGSYSTTTSQARLEAPVDDLAERLARMTMNVNGGGLQMSSTKPAFDGSKQQFCFVESSLSPAYDRGKQQFSSSSASSSSGYDMDKQQFCIVEPPSSSAYDGNKQQFCIVEPSAPSPPALDASKRKQFCIVHT